MPVLFQLSIIEWAADEKKKNKFIEKFMAIRNLALLRDSVSDMHCHTP